MTSPWRIVGINFDHMHMGDLLRHAFDHPNAEIVGICDHDMERMKDTIAALNISSDRVFLDANDCIRQVKPDLIILCPATADHAIAFEQCCGYGVDILMEKPFAANLQDADRIIKAMLAAGTRLAINWPLRWYPVHATTKRLIDEGVIGDVTEVHFYDGNRGPLYHLADKIEVTDEEVQRKKPTSWWYKTASGGGSLLDYLGYGATLGTWFMNGRAPLTVTSIVSAGKDIEVDEHSITVCRYNTGLSKFETRWGTFTDPWTLQPQPKCGFVVVGTAGTISSHDFKSHIGLQTKERPQITHVPVDVLKSPYRNPIEYVLYCKETNTPITGPLDPALCRTAQRIIDTAVESAKQQKTLELLR
ncbi:hypothetical protein HDV62DRAFT_401084 [Trichoderma sp. SZMC 28011]